MCVCSLPQTTVLHVVTLAVITPSVITDPTLGMSTLMGAKLAGYSCMAAVVSAGTVVPMRSSSPPCRRSSCLQMGPLSSFTITIPFDCSSP